MSYSHSSIFNGNKRHVSNTHNSIPILRQNLFAHKTSDQRMVRYQNPACGHMFPTHIRNFTYIIYDSNNAGKSKLLATKRQTRFFSLMLLLFLFFFFSLFRFHWENKRITFATNFQVGNERRTWKKKKRRKERRKSIELWVR